LHPDTEIDANLKGEKEEIMKQVTAAYELKDLSTLLKLEMEWVHKTSEHLEKLSDEKLEIYISALKQQASELEIEKTNLHYHPRYQQVSAYGRFPEKFAISEIRQNISELKRMGDNLNLYIRTFSKPNAKKEISAFINEYCKEYESDESTEYWE